MLDFIVMQMSKGNRGKAYYVLVVVWGNFMTNRKFKV